MPSIRPALPTGTQIEFCEMLAIVHEDHGGDSLVVDCEGNRMRWNWTFEGETCRVIETKPGQPVTQ